MALDIPPRDPKKELFPCFCYEFEREFIRDGLRKHPERAGNLPWLSDFERPYLLLNPRERKKIAEIYPSYFNKELSDFGKGDRPKGEIERDVIFWLSLRKSTSRQGRAAFAAKLRTSLRYLGAYRILQKFTQKKMLRKPFGFGQ